MRLGRIEHELGNVCRALIQLERAQRVTSANLALVAEQLQLHGVRLATVESLRATPLPILDPDEGD
jgi:hypothetical protein